MVAFYWAMAAALVASAYAMSTLFARAQLANLFCPFLYALSMIPAFLVVFGQARTPSNLTLDPGKTPPPSQTCGVLVCGRHCAPLTRHACCAA